MDGVYRVSKELQQRAKEYRRGMYADHPGTLQFAKSRRIFLIILTGLALLHLLIFFILVAQGLLSSSYLLQELVKCLIHLFIFFISVHGTWKSSIFLWLIAISSIGSLLMAFPSMSELCVVFAIRDALLTSMLVCEVFYTVLVSLGAAWLTLSSKSRKNADMVRGIYQSYLRYIQTNLYKEHGGI